MKPKTKVWIVPHTHFDVEVFITKEETLDIGFSNLILALKLFRSDPKFRFVLDQTSYIEPFLKAYPEEREFFQRMIEEGRLEITGGMYIMPDVNIPSGESFIRQIALGKKYCRKELKVDPRCGWTIDTFGRHPQMPQLMKKCGFDYDAFQRLMKKESPSEFLWQGLDGTRLLCHWMPGSYGILFGVPSNIHEFTTYIEPRLAFLKSHAVTDHILACGGGDITPPEPQLIPMIEEYNRRQNDYELVPATPSEFFEAIKDHPNLPVVTGDLNPVFQGCYSARIEIKQWNRQLENLLVTWEKFDAIRRVSGPTKPISNERIDEAWEPILFNQFHDIICGCHVDKVFSNTMDRFKYSRQIVSAGLETTLVFLVDEIDTRGDGIPVVVFNPLSWNRSDAVECSVAFSESDVFEIDVRNSAGRPVISDLLKAERYETGGIKRATILFIARDVPALGYEVYFVNKAGKEITPTDLSTNRAYPCVRADLNVGVIENMFFKVEFNLWNGTITSLFDKINRWEVLTNHLKMGNLIVKEQDYGNFWQYNGPCKGDALSPVPAKYPLGDLNSPRVDFAHRYDGDGWIIDGRARCEMVINHPFGTGHFSTRVRLYAGIDRIDVQTTLVNNDERVRYRMALPTGITDGTITHEIPFGAIERPEGEYPAQNWIDYSKDNKGIALLNRGLPGNNVADGVLMLSLLKCTGIKEGYGEVGGFKLSTPTDGGYEKGKTHTFDYAFVPHPGDWRQAGLYRKGAEYNQPLIGVKARNRAGRLAKKMSFMELSARNVVLSALKNTDEGIVVRIYEAEGRNTSQVSLKPAWPMVKIFETDLLEGNEKGIDFDPNTNLLTFDIQAFEIKTFKMILKEPETV
jgi:alpha-mannosidase